MSLAGVFFAGASFAAKLVSSANDAPLRPVPNVVASFVLLPDVLVIGTHLRLQLVVTVWLSSAAGLLSKSTFFVLAIRSARLPLPCNSPSDSLGLLFAVLRLFSDVSSYVPTTIGEVPCGRGALLSSGLVSVLVAGSAGLGRVYIWRVDGVMEPVFLQMRQMAVHPDQRLGQLLLRRLVLEEAYCPNWDRL